MSGLAAGGSGYIVGLLSVTKTANRQVTRQVPPREAAPIGLYLLRKTCWRSSRFALRSAGPQAMSGWHAQSLRRWAWKNEACYIPLFGCPTYFLPLEDDAPDF